ncbi:MAG: tetratricopeptide repeat protein [Gammaproteobacteria bacterium]
MQRRLVTDSERFSDILENAHTSATAQQAIANEYYNGKSCPHIPEKDRIYLAYAWVNIAKANPRADKTFKKGLQDIEDPIQHKMISIHSQQKLQFVRGQPDPIDKDKLIYDAISTNLLCTDLKKHIPLARENNPKAQYEIARGLMQRLPIPNALKNAKRLLFLALQNASDSQSKNNIMLAIAEIYEKQNNVDLAIHWCKAVAASGNPIAFDKLSKYYFKKAEQSAEFEYEANKWTLLSAENDNPDAQLHIAKQAMLRHKYKTEHGVRCIEPEFNTAIRYLNKVLSNTQKHPHELEAMCLLGLIYAKDPGKNHEFNYAAALENYNSLLLEKSSFAKNRYLTSLFEQLEGMVKILKEQREHFVQRKQAEARKEKLDAIQIIEHTTRKHPYLKQYHAQFVFSFKQLLDNYKNARGGVIRMSPIESDAQIVAFLDTLTFIPYSSHIIKPLTLGWSRLHSKERQRSYKTITEFFKDIRTKSSAVVDQDAYIEYLATVVTLMKFDVLKKIHRKQKKLLEHFNSALTGKQVTAVEKMAEEDVNRCFQGILQRIVEVDEHSILDFTQLAMYGEPMSEKFKDVIKTCFNALNIHTSTEKLRPDFNHLVHTTRSATEIFTEEHIALAGLFIPTSKVAGTILDDKKSELKRVESASQISLPPSPSSSSLSLDVESDVDTDSDTELSPDSSRAAQEASAIDEREQLAKCMLLDIKMTILNETWSLGWVSKRNQITDKNQTKIVPAGVAEIYSYILEAEKDKRSSDSEIKNWYAALLKIQQVAIYATLHKKHRFYNRQSTGTTAFYDDVIAATRSISLRYPEKTCPHTYIVFS